MSLSIIKHGIFDTVQDIGRFGFSNWGINPSGAMDQFAARYANALVGNDQNQAVLELHFPASRIFFSEGALISITGANLSANLDGFEIPPWKTIAVPPSSTLTFRERRNGFRAYMAVHGGFDLPKWLNSASTNLKVGVGGFHGRALRKGDELNFNVTLSIKTREVYKWSINWPPVYDVSTIDIIPDEGWKELSRGDQQFILDSPFNILPKSDRMGYYFDHAPLHMERKEQLLSSAVAFGTIQLLPSGKLVCLMADHQTTGGYPRIGTVISAHLPKLSQCPPGTSIRLGITTIEEAEKRLLSLYENLNAAASSLPEKIKGILDDHRP